MGRYTEEFKREAVRLLDLGEKPAKELAMELGIKRTLLYRWRDQLREKGEAAFSGGGRPKNDQMSEIAKLMYRTMGFSSNTHEQMEKATFW